MATRIDHRVGTDFLGYRIDALIGRGGMGVVYRAYDLRLKRNVALKLIAPELSQDERFRERFVTETEIAAALEHPNVVPIHDAGEYEGQLYLAMRHVEGSDLKALLQEGPLDPARAIAICSPVAAALDAAHARGLVHRDVKPSNVLLDNQEHVYLADFGLSRRLSEQAPGLEATLSLGTPAYVAPEQIQGDEVDERADQYSLGCLLYECLAGEAPYPRESELAVLWAHLNDPPPASPGLEDVMAKALAKEPDLRYGSCRELVEAAGGALGLGKVRRDRRPLLLAATGVMLALAAGLSVFFLSRGDGGPARPSTKPTLTPKIDSLQRIDPNTNGLAATIGAGSRPNAVAVGDDAVWVLRQGDGTISRIDPVANRVERTGPAGTAPVSVAAGHGVLWVMGGADFGGGGALTQLDPETLEIKRTVPMLADSPVDGGGLVIREHDIWVSNTQGLERRGLFGEKIALIENLLIAAPSPSSLVLARGDLWTPETAGIARIDTRRNRLVARIPIPLDPRYGITGIAGIAAGAGSIWLTIAPRDAVLRIDSATNRVTGRLRVGDDPIGIAFGEGWLWVANHDDGTVSKIDPKVGKVVATFRVGPNPTDIAAGEGGVWVAVHPG